MAWRIELAETAKKQLAKIDRRQAQRILRFLREGVASAPRNSGKPMKGTRFWRYRIGHYRAICELHDDTLVVLVLRVGHRGKIYRGTN